MRMPKLDGGSGGGGSSNDDSGGTVSAPGFTPGGSNDPAEGGDGYIDDDPPDPTPPEKDSKDLRITSDPEPDSDPGRLPDAEREPTQTDMEHDKLDLGNRGTRSKVYDDRNAGMVVDTGDVIDDAGGPGAVLAGNIDQVHEINKTISDVTGQLKDAQNDGPLNVTENVPTLENVPAPDFGGIGGLGKALLAAVAVAVAFAIGGN